ncbi:dockerin type I domain-containing protein, partial [Ruminococcus sp.]|uniref:dockerin type I domain-containing protein n=1 Tax=Ruminococcus sp. TaxID=41978 RepID=UPI003A8D3281
LTFKAERNSVSSAVGAYNMSSGDITSLIVPTTASQATQPTTARPTQPTTAKPTTQPTTQPTTAKPTESKNLNVTATSNYFPSANVKATKGKTVCVEYVLNSSMDVVNAEWALTYDKTKLELDTVRSKDYMPNIPNEVTNVKKADGKVLSNFTDISNLADFKGGKVFVRAYFKVISTGETTVNLNVKTLSVGYIQNGSLTFKPVVRGSVIQPNVTSTPGFEKLVINRNTKVYLYSDDNVMLGDVTGDGQIDVNDVTAIQLYIAQKQSFTDKQKEAADVNKDGIISVLDVTRVQQYIARNFDEF